MVKIYINNVLQRTEILPANTPTKDETLETFSFALMSNENPMPLAPGQTVKVDFKGDGTDIAYFFLTSDSVETCSLKPLRYKHSITCTQNTRRLSKYLVRNSTFTQPFYLKKSSFNVNKRFCDGVIGTNVPPDHDWTYEAWRGQEGDAGDLNFFSTPLTLLDKEKITNAKLKISFQYGEGAGWGSNPMGYLYAYDEDVSEIPSRVKSGNNYTYSEVSFDLAITLKYTDGNGNAQTRSLSPADFGIQEFNLNDTYNFPLIVELAQQGCNDFEILFDYTDLLTAKIVDDLANSHHRLMVWMVQVSIEAEVYYYNCYDILELLINRQKKQTSLRPNDAPLFELPQSGELYDLLKNTIAPNFTFTDLTMYECVAEIFRVFDAIFTMDENGVLGIEYFNDLSEGTISESTKFAGRTLALGEDKYTNGLVANYQDARILESFPSDGGFAHLRSAEFGIPEQTDHNFIVPHGIDNIVKCEIIIDNLDLSRGTNGTDSKHFDGEMTVDITDYVLDQDAWSSLAASTMSDSDFNNMVKKKSNCVYYVKGDNKIQVGAVNSSFWFLTKYAIQNAVDTALIKFCGAYYGNGAHYTARVDELDTILAGDWKAIKMRVIYQTSIDGKTKIQSITNKYPGETLIDQINGAVDLNKMGLNMLGLALKIGEPTLSATHTITSWNNRIRTGQIYNWQGSLWIANVVNYTLMGGRIQGKISFVKNFNALSLRTQLLREKRMSNISKELVQKSEEIITDYVYYSSSDPSASYESEDIHFDKYKLQVLIEDTFTVNPRSNYKVGDAVVNFGEMYSALDATMIKLYYIPMVKYGAGNTINFEMAFDHPMNAGNKTIYTNNKYFTDHVIYTDERGYRETAGITIFDRPWTYDEDFPLILAPVSRLDESVLHIANYKVYKQPNEIFALNYQLAFLPVPGSENTDFLGSEFINNNCFVKDNVSGKNARYIVFKNIKSSIIENKASPYFAKKPITSFSFYSYPDTNLFSLTFNFDALTEQELGNNTIKSWAIVDDNENILFASNKTNIASTSVNIYFFTKLYRLI